MPLTRAGKRGAWNPDLVISVFWVALIQQTKEAPTMAFGLFQHSVGPTIFCQGRSGGSQRVDAVPLPGTAKIRELGESCGAALDSFAVRLTVLYLDVQACCVSHAVWFLVTAGTSDVRRRQAS